MTVPQVVPEIMAGAGPFDVAGDFYLDLVGVSSGNAVTPDAAVLDITGDIDIRVEATLDDWSPTEARYLVSKYVSSGNQRSFLFYVGANGRLAVQWSNNGTAVLGETSPVKLTDFPARRGLRVTVDVNDGAGNRVIKFYTSDSISGSWTEISSTTTAGTTSFHSGTAPLEVGNTLNGGSTPFGGRIHAMELRDGIAGTVVANPDFTAQTPGTTSFSDAAGRAWTVNSPATIGGFNWEPIPDEIVEGRTRQRLKSLVWDVGRSSELEVFTPGRGTAVLRSNDRLLDPEHTTGQFFGQLLPRVPLRFRCVSPSADLFYGFPEDGWEQAYDRPYASRCTVEMVDLLGAISDMPLPQTAYEAEVLFDNPEAFWQLDEKSGVQMADSSGNDRHGVYDNGIPADPLVFGGDGAFEAPHVGDNRGRFSGEGLPVAAPASIEAWIKTDRDAAAVKSIVVVQRDASLGQRLWLGIQSSAGGSPNGEVVIDFAGLGTNYKARGSTRIDDDQPHHIVMTIAGNTAAEVLLYVDGALETKTTISGTNPGSWPSLVLWTVGNYTDNGFGDFGLDGVIDAVAIYDYVLEPGRVAAHYEAGTTAFSDDPAGTRIDRVLDLVGVPAALRDIATGDTLVGPATYGGATAGEYLNKVVESEQGFLYVDHPGGGKLKFRGRYSRLTETRSTVSQATFTDNPDAVGAWRYRPDIAPEPNGYRTIVNTVRVQWRGGTETVTDPDSIAAYGPRSRTITTEAATPEAARSAGAWFISRFGQPQSRIRRLPLTPGGGQTGLAAVVLGQQISDRVTVQRHPQGIGAVITNELIVEGIHNAMEPGQSWLAHYMTSDADDTEVGIWGTSTWDTARWG